MQGDCHHHYQSSSSVVCDDYLSFHCKWRSTFSFNQDRKPWRKYWNCKTGMKVKKQATIFQCKKREGCVTLLSLHVKETKSSPRKWYSLSSIKACSLKETSLSLYNFQYLGFPLMMKRKLEVSAGPSRLSVKGRVLPLSGVEKVGRTEPDLTQLISDQWSRSQEEGRENQERETYWFQTTAWISRDWGRKRDCNSWLSIGPQGSVQSLSLPCLSISSFPPASNHHDHPSLPSLLSWNSCEGEKEIKRDINTRDTSFVVLSFLSFCCQCPLRFCPSDRILFLSLFSVIQRLNIHCLSSGCQCDSLLSLVFPWNEWSLLFARLLSSTSSPHHLLNYVWFKK